MKMNFFLRALTFSTLVYVGDLKSLDSNFDNESENHLSGENIIKKVDSKISQKEMELKELKKNIGKVGNKLEGIVYEVLKNFLDKDFESSELENEHYEMVTKKTEAKEYVTETLLKKYPTLFGNEKSGKKSKVISVIHDEVVHSENDLIENKLVPNLEKSSSTESILEYTIELPTKNELNVTSNSLKIIPYPISMKNNTKVDENMNKNWKNQNTMSGVPSFAKQNSTQFLKTKTTDVSEIPIKPNKPETFSDQMKTRRRRMIQANPEQVPSSENFIEPNSERRERISKPRRRFDNRPEEPQLIGLIHSPEEEIRISHRRSESTPVARNTEKGENLIYIPKESHRKRKNPSDERQIEEVPDVSKSKRIMTPVDQISENSESPKTQNVPSESDDKKFMKLNSVDNSDGLDNIRLGQSFAWGNQQPPPCYEKNEREDLLEKQHIEDLKYEVGKLRSVVDLLREQQRLLNSFDYGERKNINGQEMLTVLNQINSKEKLLGPNDKSQTNVDLLNKAKHEELEQIKFQLKEAINNLNKTKEILNLEHQKELNLEEELKHQKTEINWLKLVMENFIIAQTKQDKRNKDPKLNELQDIKRNETENSIVGAAFPSLLRMSSSNRTIPSTVKMAEDKIKELEAENGRYSNDRGISERLTSSRSSSSSARANEFSTIGRLLDMINDKQSKSDDDDAQLKLLEAVSDLKKKKEKENLTKELLQKLQGGAESKSDDDDLSQLLKIQKVLKSLETPQSKIEDLDIEDQLKLLQKEINKLRPNDDFSFLPTESKAPANNPAQFQAMLTKLINANPQLQGSKLPTITPQQMMQLQKKLMAGNSVTTAGVGNLGGDIGTGSPVQNPQFLGTNFPPITPQQLMQLQKKLNTGNGIATAGIGNLGGDIGTGSPGSLVNPLSAGLGKMGSYLGPLGTGPYVSPINAYQALYGGLGNSGYGSLGLGGGGYGVNGYPLGYSGASIAPYAQKAPYGASIWSGYSPNYLSAAYKPKYAKMQDAIYGMNPYNGQSNYPNPISYGSKVDTLNSEKQSYGGNNFFQIPGLNSYGGSPPSSYFPPKAFDPEGFDKINTNQLPYSGSPSPYAADKIDDLKNQIYGLQSAISSYNRPEYTQTPEDRNTIYSLEQQIEELKGIVSTLNGYPVLADQQSYGPPVGNYESIGYGSPDIQTVNDNYNNRASEKRSKRSTENTEGHNGYEVKFYDKVREENEKKRSVGDDFEKNGDDGMLHKVTSIIGGVFNNEVKEQKSRSKRSTDDNTVEETQASGVLEKLTSALRDVLDEESDASSTRDPLQPLPLHPRRLTNQIRYPSNEITHQNTLVKHATLQDIKHQIDHLKKQLGHHKTDGNVSEMNRNIDLPIYNQINPFSTRHALMPEPPYGNYNYNYGANGLAQFTSDLSVKPKKLDIFKSIVAKIMDKVIESLPVILHKLFGFAVHELTAYGDYGTSYGGYGSDNSIFKVFKNLGVFGYLPLILLRLVNAVSSFIYVLQKNKFLKYFLVPAGVVLLVGGSLVFLIWWMQPSDYYLNYEKSYDKYSNDKEYSDGYDNQNDYGKSSRQIIKSYGVNEGKPRVNTYKSTPEVKAPFIPNNLAYPPFYKAPQMSISPDYMMPTYGE